MGTVESDHTLKCQRFLEVPRSLQEEGEHVGNNNYTGFTAALNRVAKRKQVDLQLVKARDPKAIAHAVTPNTDVAGLLPRISSTHATSPVGRLPNSSSNDLEPSGPREARLPCKEAAADPARPSFFDTRFSSDF